MKCTMGMAAISVIALGTAMSALAHADVKPIDGNWISNCSDTQSQHYKEDLYLYNGNEVLDIHQYIDAGCFTKAYDVEISTTYSQSDSKVLAGAENIDQIYGRIYITAWSDDIVAQFNTQGYCGFYDWGIGAAHLVNGKQCGTQKMPLAGDKGFDLVMVDATNQLRMGQKTVDLNGSSADKRPQVLDSSVVFHRQLQH